MRVGLVTDFYYPWIGGPSSVLRNLGHGLCARGHSVSLLAPSHLGPPLRERDGPVEVLRVPTLPVPFGYNLRAAGLPLGPVKSWLETWRPDVVNVHHPFPLSAAALLLARRRGIPVVATNHTIPECSLWGMRGAGLPYRLTHEAFARWLVFLLGRADEVVTPTETAAGLLRRLGFQRPVCCISNGIDTRRFAPGDDDAGLRASLGLDRRPIVLYTGRLDAEKQMDLWLRAAAHLARERDVQLVVGGQGADRARLERLADALGLRGRVRFIGYLPDETYPLLYRLAAVYFIMSPVELQSITTLEALASGVPIVAVQAGALPELVSDGINGRLVAPGDWQAASAALEDVLSNEERRNVMGAASRNKAKAHDLQLSIAQYEQVLQGAAPRCRGDRIRERSTAAGR